MLEATEGFLLFDFFLKVAAHLVVLTGIMQDTTIVVVTEKNLLKDAATRAPFEIRESPIQGNGAFATVKIPGGIRLIEYAGQRLTPAESDARYPDDEAGRHHTYLFAIDEDVVI
ncbi:MAG: hypothetical protein ABJC63_09240, partial [Gemmatimonadales bacterium]